MKGTLKDFIDKTVMLYTISGIESYLGILKVVEEDYVLERPLEEPIPEFRGIILFANYIG